MLKRYIKSVFLAHPKYDAKKIINQIGSYSYISFDIFDTLVKRSVGSPQEVFYALGENYKDKTFKEKRIKAERKARDMAKAQGREEICIEEIYACMPMPYCNDTEKWIASELNAEMSVCYCNQIIKEVYDWCVQKKKHILIISDMYASKSFLTELLKNCGYTQYEAFFLSSEYGLKKRTGNLYTKVLENYQVDAKEIIHIGDTLKSDYLMAKKKGMNAVLLARNNNGHTMFCSNRHVEKNEMKKHSELCSFIESHISQGWNPHFQFGYEAFGPVLYGFSRWLLNDVEKRGIKKIFFFSRDGYIMQKAFHEVVGDQYKTDYFYVSRRSLRVPQLWINPDFSAVIDSFPQVSMLSMRAFMKNLGLDVEEYSELLKKYGFRPDDSFLRQEITSNAKISSFYQEIKNDVIKNSKKEFDLLVEYMKQQHFEGNVAVVDIGWYGSLQYFLSAIIKAAKLNVHMEGYYIGLTNEMRKGIDAHGYVKDDENTPFCDSWRGFSGLIEYLFLAQEGSCKTYQRIEGRIIPVLYDYEYETNGNKEAEAEHAHQIQKGALQFIEDAVSARYSMDVNCRTAYANLRNAGNYPTQVVCDLFCGIRFLEETPVFLAQPASLLTYAKDPKKFKKEFYYSKWKIGFLKQMLKFPLPYKRIYELAKKF